MVPARVSNGSTAPSRQLAEAVWSIGPQGTPTKSFSARCVMRAIVSESRVRPAGVATASTVAHSTASEEDRPAPQGTWESSSRSTGPTG
ncbi:MAG TPA: hypothetical protein VIC62_18580 [Nakamurella sp.]